MFTILETTTNRVLFAKYDDIVLENQTAIEQICTIENPNQKDIYYNFTTHEFYIAE